MNSTLTASAMDELADLFKLSRRTVAEVYREYRLGSNASEIAEARGYSDPRRIDDVLSSLRILFGRQSLPKRGEGRQLAINEASHWLNADVALSEELQEHLNRILLLAKRTNARTKEYEPPAPVLQRAEPKKRRPNGADGHQSGVYVITRKAYADEAGETDPILFKIGYSNSVWERIDSAQTWFHDEVVILRVYLVEDPKPMELKFQVILDLLELNVQENGGTEWFKADLQLIDSIASTLKLRDCSKDVTPVDD